MQCDLLLCLVALWDDSELPQLQLLSKTFVMSHFMKHFLSDCRCFPAAVRSSFHSRPSLFFSPRLYLDFPFFVVLLNKDAQRFLRRSPQAPVGLGAVAPPAPLPLIAADAVPHPNASVELERWRWYQPLRPPRDSNADRKSNNSAKSRRSKYRRNVIFFTIRNQSSHLSVLLKFVPDCKKSRVAPLRRFVTRFHFLLSELFSYIFSEENVACLLPIL